MDKIWFRWEEVMQIIGGNNMFLFDKFMLGKDVPLFEDGEPCFHINEINQFKNNLDNHHLNMV